MALQEKINYLLQIADNNLILGQRLGEWCGHGPVLEQDIALTNIALDLIGQARSLYNQAAKLEQNGKTEDSYPFLRDVREWRNVLLVEQDNKDFAHTIVRQFFYDAFNVSFLNELQNSNDEFLSAFGEKSLKEARYHYLFSSEWMKRLGDGTEESHNRMQLALDNLWMYHGELFETSETDNQAIESGYGVDLEKIKGSTLDAIKSIIEEATLKIPESNWMQSGGKKGMHSEHLGHILSELQYLQRAYPNATW